MDLKKLIENALREKDGLEGLEVRDVREKPCTNPGDNYMSIVSLMEVLGRLPGGTDYTGSVFVKRPTEGAERRKVFHVDDAFNNESIFYLHLLPLCDVTVACARCYHAGAELILLQNLRAEGYNMQDRRNGLDLQTATHVLKAVARLHAATYRTIHTKGEEFFNHASNLKPIGFSLPSHLDMLTSSLKRIIGYVSQVPDLNKYSAPLQRMDQRAAVILKELRRAKDIQVLCHGDCWVNNILVRPEDRDPVRLVDFQACSVLSPAVDIWTFMYSSLQPQVQENFDQLLLTYCTDFLEDLRIFKTPLREMPSLAGLKEELLSRELYGFFAGAMYTPALMMDSINVPNLDTLTEAQFSDEEFLKQFVTPDLLERYVSLIKFSDKRGLFESSFLKP